MMAPAMCKAGPQTPVRHLGPAFGAPTHFLGCRFRGQCWCKMGSAIGVEPLRTWFWLVSKMFPVLERNHHGCPIGLGTDVEPFSCTGIWLMVAKQPMICSLPKGKPERDGSWLHYWQMGVPFFEGAPFLVVLNGHQEGNRRA